MAGQGILWVCRALRAWSPSGQSVFTVCTVHSSSSLPVSSAEPLGHPARPLWLVAPDRLPCMVGRRAVSRPGKRGSESLPQVCRPSPKPRPALSSTATSSWTVMEAPSGAISVELRIAVWAAGLLPGHDREGQGAEVGVPGSGGRYPPLSRPQQQEVQKEFLCFPQGWHEAPSCPHLEDRGLAVSFGVLESERWGRAVSSGSFHDSLP